MTVSQLHKLTKLAYSFTGGPFLLLEQNLRMDCILIVISCYSSSTIVRRLEVHSNQSTPFFSLIKENNKNQLHNQNI